MVLFNCKEVKITRQMGMGCSLCDLDPSVILWTLHVLVLLHVENKGQAVLRTLSKDNALEHGQQIYISNRRRFNSGSDYQNAFIRSIYMEKHLC